MRNIPQPPAAASSREQTIPRLQAPRAGSPDPEWDRFERKGDAIELYRLREKEGVLDAEIASLGPASEARWPILAKLDPLVCRRIFLERRLQA